MLAHLSRADSHSRCEGMTTSTSAGATAGGGVARRDFARFMTTILYPQHPDWEQRATMIDRDARSIPATLKRLVAEGRRHEAAVLMGAVPARKGYVDLLAAARLARMPNGPLVVVSECTWEPGSRTLSDKLGRVLPALGGHLPIDGITKAAIRRLDGPRTIFCVLSESERAPFAATWGIDAARVAVTHFSSSLSPEELTAPTERGDFVFAGGDPLRDHQVLVDAAEGLGAEVHMATRRWKPTAPERVPRNVHVGPVPHEEFVRLLRGCGAVAVPLAASRIRSSGQQTFLNAMAYRKPVIITDALGVSDYLTDGEHARIVPVGDARAMHEALAWVLDPANRGEVDAMVDRAFELVSRWYLPGHYEGRLMAVVDHYLDVLGRWPEDR